MKKIQFAKSVTARLVLVLLMLAILGSLLTGCGTQASKISVSLSDIEYNESENNLAKEDLKTLADYIGNNATVHIQFVAAYRGYDMNAENYDPNAEAPALEPRTDYAVKLLGLNDTKKALADVDYSGLTVADMESVIDSLKVEINKEADRGFLETLQYWIGVALSAITNTVGFGNYLVGICLFAIIIEIAMLPLSIKQQKNSIRQAQLRPKELAIRRKYAGRNDQATQQKIQQDIQELYTRENFNPMSGCLPLLIQMPIILILYNIVVDPICYTLGLSSQFSTALSTYYTTPLAAGGLGQSLTSTRGSVEILSQLKDLDFSGISDFLFYENGAKCLEWLGEISDKIPSFSIGALNFGLIPSIGEFNWLWAIPVLTFAIYFGSMKLTRKLTYQPVQANDPQVGCSNNIMDISMPLMSAYISFIVPATLSVYWIFKSLLNTLKQFILSRVMPTPQCTEEDIKAAEKELKGKKSNHKHSQSTTARAGDGTKPRSLHHIDDDDELPSKNIPQKPAPAKEAKPAEAPNTPIEQSPLKDDSDNPNKKD